LPPGPIVRVRFRVDFVRVRRLPPAVGFRVVVRDLRRVDGLKFATRAR